MYNTYLINHKPCTSEKIMNEYHQKALENNKDFLEKYKNTKGVTDASYSLSDIYTLSILDQGQYSTCVVNSFAGIINSFKPDFNTSRFYHYYICRIATGQKINDDKGLDISEVMPYLKDYGILPETQWQYSDVSYNTIQHKNISYFSKMKYSSTNIYNSVAPTEINYEVIGDCTTISDTIVEIVKEKLTNGKFVLLGIYIFNSFCNNKTNNTGIINMPIHTLDSSGNPIITLDASSNVIDTNNNIVTMDASGNNVSPNDYLGGGHCVHIVGWTGNYFIIRNSWGTNWGNNGLTNIDMNFENNGSNGGFGYLPINYLKTKYRIINRPNILKPIAFELYAISKSN